MEPAKEQQPAHASALQRLCFYRLTSLRLRDEAAAAAPHHQKVFRVDTSNGGEDVDDEEQPGAESSGDGGEPGKVHAHREEA